MPHTEAAIQVNWTMNGGETVEIKLLFHFNIVYL